MSESSAQKRLTRRTVAKGAAWTVPVVAVAAPVATAATSPKVITFDADGDSCKHSAGSGGVRYYFIFDTTLPVGTSVTITAWTWAPNDGTQLFVEFNPGTTQVTSSGQLVYRFLENNTSATNGELCVSFSYDTGTVQGIVDVCTGNNNYSSCGNDVPIPSPGDTVTIPGGTKTYPVPAP